MQLDNDFIVAASLAQAWPVLIDLERVVPCLPGASLDSVDGQTFTGQMTMKLGPMSLAYRGGGKLAAEEATRTIVVEAAGGEQRGGGSAAATITATLEPLDEIRTRVRVTTDLDLSGKPAQFGRGILVDVAGRLLSNFAIALEQELLSTSPTVASDKPAVAPLDLGATTVLPLLKRVGPALLGAVALAVLVRHLTRRTRG